MKKIFILLSLIILLSSITTDTPTPIKKIETIFNSPQFKISIERLDFGYIINQQLYNFEVKENILTVTQDISWNPNQPLTLNNTVLTENTSTLLSNYCSAIKTFEITKIDEHKELFNSNDIHDFIYITNYKDTVLLSDVKEKAINGIRNIIENNRK